MASRSGKGGRDLLAGRPFHVLLEKDRWKFFNDTEGPGGRCSIELNTRASSMRIDWRPREGAHLVGVFAVSDDGLRYSFREAASGYPTSLTTPAAEDYVVELVREKK